jgi:F-type H+-transporting ATPase subunit delta
MRPASLQGASRESFAAARETLSTLVRSGDTDLPALADDLFAVTAVLDEQGPLRRALTDPSRSGDDRASLVRGVFGDKVGTSALDVLAWAVRARWSSSRDLSNAVELLAVDSLMASAEKAGRLETVEDELFRVGRIVAGTPDLRTALSDQSAPVTSRAALIEGLLEGKVSDETRRLVLQAVTAPRGRTFDSIMSEYVRVAAQRRDQLVATVTATVPLTEEQRGRLRTALSRIYGHEIHLNVDVDTSLIGGVRVAIGDEVIDGSVAAKLDDARRRLVG